MNKCEGAHTLANMMWL